MRRLAASLALTLVAGAAFADNDSYLFDALRSDPYLTSWNKLMKDVQPTPDWLLQFNRNFDGVAGQFNSITIGGKPYLLSFVCEPTSCAKRKFEVLFDADGEHAYGALGGRNEEPAFYGDPPPELQDALAKTFKG
ncbi:MAG: Ivy family c-type lysozyme inhibitor [Roseiarcus sp.]